MPSRNLAEKSLQSLSGCVYRLQPQMPCRSHPSSCPKEPHRTPVSKRQTQSEMSSHTPERPIAALPGVLTSPDLSQALNCRGLMDSAGCSAVHKELFQTHSPRPHNNPGQWQDGVQHTHFTDESSPGHGSWAHPTCHTMPLLGYLFTDVQEHEAHSQRCVTITTVHLQNSCLLAKPKLCTN